MSKEKVQVFSSILIIVLLIIAFQYRSLNLGMYGDDYGAFRAYSYPEIIKALYSDMCEILIPCSTAYRPMTIAMLHSTYTIFGFDPYKLHMMIIVLQIIQTIIAFFFFRMLTKKNALSLAGCLLFPLNPNLWMHFTWNTEIPNLIGMIFFLLSLVSLISYIRNPRYFMISLHFIFAILAYFSKETYYAICFVSILTIVFYRKDGKAIFKQYVPIVGWHLIIFTAYITGRFLILKKWGGATLGVSPDHNSGITVYAWNYVRFFGEISLFNHYISSGFGYFLIYIGIICIMLIAFKKVLSSLLTLCGKVTLKSLIYFLLSVISLQSLWLFKRINILPELLQSNTPFYIAGIAIDSMHYKDILFLYSIMIYIAITLIWIYRKRVKYLDKQSIEGTSRLEETAGSNKHFNKLSNFGENEIIVNFSIYSVLMVLVSSLPMFFFPNGRIMNVIALGMGGVFASGVFIVSSMLGKHSHNSYSPFVNKILRYVMFSAFIIFVLNNSVMFQKKYIGPESIYLKNNIPTAIASYVKRYAYFKKYDLKEHGAYLFNTLVSSGLVERSSGKLMVEKIKVRYPDLEDVFSWSELDDFQPPDATIYPITN